MSHGIAIVGANGSGKTTLGKHLAHMLSYRHMDAEDYFFRPSAVPYANPLAKEEARELLLADMKKPGPFVFSAVNGDFGEDVTAMYDCVVYIDVPLGIRLERVRQRSVLQFGSRVFEGGDLYEQEQAFFPFCCRAHHGEDGPVASKHEVPCHPYRRNKTGCAQCCRDHKTHGAVCPPLTRGGLLLAKGAKCFLLCNVIGEMIAWRLKCFMFVLA